MKLYKLFIIVIMIFAAAAVMTKTASAQKANRNWVEFTGFQTVSFGQNMIPGSYNCDSSIYATANFASPVDLTDGFYVTIAANGKLLIQEKMTVDNAPDSIRSIPVDLVPDDDADLGFPTASMAYSRALLIKLKPGKHTITIAVSVGEGETEIISAGNFTFDNRRGCAERFERVNNLINGTATSEVEPEVEPTEEETEETRPPSRPQTSKQQPQQQPAQNGRVKFINKCGELRTFDFWFGTQYRNGRMISANTEETTDLPVGTKIFLRTANGDKLVHTVQEGAGEDGWGQQVATCQ